MHCLWCGSPTSQQTIEGRPRQVCSSCGRVHYLQLKLGAGVLLQHGGRLLLVRRGSDADAFPGAWCIPAGYCESDEPPSVAAARETLEETGLEVSVGRLVDAYFFDDDWRGNGILMVYEAEAVAGSLESVAGRVPVPGEVDAMGLFGADGLPEPLCGGGHDRAIGAWRKGSLDRWEPGLPLRFCPHCAHHLQEGIAFGRLRRLCPACGFVHFREPKVGVSLLVEHAGSVLLVQRAIAPGKGKWSLPSGFIEWDETPEAAAVRECQEETGLQISDLRLLDVVHYAEDFRGPGINLLYQGRIAGGVLRAGDDASSARFFAAGELPPHGSIAFPGHSQALDRWVEAVRRQ